MGLRGGSWSIGFDDVQATIELNGDRFSEDVAVSGKAGLPFGLVSSLDATVTVDGPGGDRSRIAYPHLGLSVVHVRVDSIPENAVIPDWLKEALAQSRTA